MPERRRLNIDTINAIMPDVDALLEGHVTVGRWTLGAICDHLTRSIDLSIDSPPADTPSTREQAIYRRLFFRHSTFPEGQSLALAVQEPTPDADPVAAAESLRIAINRLENHGGPYAAHPIIGPLTRDEWLLFHTRHAAHHLSFAIPI